MYQLYGVVNYASFIPHVCLVKAGLDFDFILLDIENNEHHGEAYKKLNPNSRIPVLVDNDIADEPLVLYETAATCLHIADRHPEADLFPAIGTVERAQAYKWLMYLTNSLQTELLVFNYNERYTSDPNCVKPNRAGMAMRIADMFAIIAKEPNIASGFLVGDTPSICDYFLFTLAEWATDFEIPNGPLSHPVLVDYLACVKALPEIQETISREGFEPTI